MSGDAVELANELYERFGALTKERALKIAAAERLPTNPIPTEAVTRAVEQAAAQVLSEYPLEDGSAAGWGALYARKPSFARILDGLFLAGMKAQGGEVSEPTDALPIGDAATLSASNAGEEAARATPATPIRDSLMQYIDLKFTLYAQKEGVNKEGKSYSYFVDLQGRGKGYNNKPNAAIRTVHELDAALNAGIALFGFLPSERGFLCIDVDRGHECGADGFKNVTDWLEARGFAKGYNPLSEARVYVDTPSGGRHCYFTGKARYLAKIPGLESVDVFGEGTGATLAAAGSVKKGKAYVLHGRLADATPVNAAFAGYFANDEYTESARQAAAAREKANARPSSGNRFKSRAEHTLAEKVEYYRRKYSNNPDSKGERHDALRHVVIRLGWQYGEGELYAACLANPIFGTLTESELRGTVSYYHKKSVKQG